MITTDGFENASHRYTPQKVKAMVERQKQKYGWEFIFLGATIDAIATAREYGIDEKHSANFVCDGDGLVLQACAQSRIISNLRFCEAFDEGWKDELVADVKKRRR